MKEIITVQIIRPNLDLLDEASKQRYIEDMAKDIVNQILMQEYNRKINESMAYWDNKFQMWEIEDRIRRLQDAEKFNRVE